MSEGELFYVTIHNLNHGVNMPWLYPVFAKTPVDARSKTYWHEGLMDMMNGGGKGEFYTGEVHQGYGPDYHKVSEYLKVPLWHERDLT